jgi:anthranilate phosphoribosyltransferase
VSTTVLTSLIGRLVSGERLGAEAMEAAMGAIVRGEATPAQIGALLIGLRVGGETADELLGTARALRAVGTRVETGLPKLLDTCGTGGDGAHTFNLSTTVAFVCAGAGVPVAKHGNRAVSSRSGSADVLEALGVPLLDVAADCAEQVLRHGFAFLFAPHLHPAMRHVAGIRKELGVRTIMNLVGPLVNPASATHQLVGVFDDGKLGAMAEAFGRLGSERAIVVRGVDGLDEISPAGVTRWAEWRRETGEVLFGETHPSELGLDVVPVSAIAGGDARENAAITLAVLNGEPGPYRTATLLNAAWALYAADAAESPAAGLVLATESIDRGAARAVLQRVQRTP